MRRPVEQISEYTLLGADRLLCHGGGGSG
jgi:hypothetical protein